MDETLDRWVARDNGRFDDLHPCGEPNQYAIDSDERGLFLRLVPRNQWVPQPRIMEINMLVGVSRDRRALPPDGPDIGPDVPGGGAI